MPPQAIRRHFLLVTDQNPHRICDNLYVGIFCCSARPGPAEARMTPSEEFSKESYEINFEYRPQYMYVKVKSDRASVEMSLAVWAKIAERRTKTELKKILIETDMPKSLTAGEFFWVRSQSPAVDFPGYKIAIADPYPEKRSVNEFGDTVSFNRGVFTQTFTNFEDAEQWLLESED
jgi:hypothetical protein